MNFNTEKTSEPGAYMIYDPETDKTYVGATSNLHKRLGVHERDLKHNRHYNKGLQEIYNKKNGNLNVTICPTESKDVASAIEQDIIDTYLNTGLLVNISDNNCGHLEGYSEFRIGVKRDPEIGRKISEARMGIEFTEEHKMALSLAKKYPINIDGVDYVNIADAKRKLNASYKDIMHLAGIRKPVNSQISVDGVKYNSLKEAQEKLNITKSALMFRLNSDAEKYKGYVRLTRCSQDKRTD